MTEKDYYLLHKRCPNCGNDKYSQTFVAYIFWDNNFKDENIYKCKCGGSVHREYRKLDSDECVNMITSSNVSGKWIKQYRVFFVCDKCGDHEVEDEYWDGYDTSNDPRNTMEIGVKVINANGIKRLKLTTT